MSLVCQAFISKASDVSIKYGNNQHFFLYKSYERGRK